MNNLETRQSGRTNALLTNVYRLHKAGNKVTVYGATLRVIEYLRNEYIILVRTLDKHPEIMDMRSVKFAVYRPTELYGDGCITLFDHTVYERMIADLEDEVDRLKDPSNFPKPIYKPDYDLKRGK